MSYPDTGCGCRRSRRAVGNICADLFYSWEYGTATTAVLEHDYPDVSVYGSAPFPIPRQLEQQSYIMTNADRLMNERPFGAKTIMEDGAAGDPMSNAITMLLANFSMPGDTRFASAFHSQLGFIEHDVPRTGDGAISHRVSEVRFMLGKFHVVLIVE